MSMAKIFHAKLCLRFYLKVRLGIIFTLTPACLISSRPEVELADKSPVPVAQVSLFLYRHSPVFYAHPTVRPWLTAACQNFSLILPARVRNRLFFNIKIGLIAFSASIDHTKHFFTLFDGNAILPVYNCDYNMLTALWNIMP